LLGVSHYFSPIESARQSSLSVFNGFSASPHLAHDTVFMQSPDGPTCFSELGLSATILKNLTEIGFEAPTPIQAALIPRALSGVDCIGQARTGTGKTAAFGLPILQQIELKSEDIQAIVLAPTRELSEQVNEEINVLAHGSKVKTVLTVGGRPLKPQLNALSRYPQIVVGTPGRVIDLIQRRALDLSKVRWVILDEADRMLDIGFRKDIERILRSCSDKRQTLLLSATMPETVERLAQKYMKSPERIDLSEKNVVVDTIEQFYCTVDERNKFKLLVRLLRNERPAQAIVFCRTRRGAQNIYEKMRAHLPGVEAIHGDLAQSRRDRVIRDLRKGKARLVVATDIVGRGIDISGISHIINYDIPEGSDDYVHRVGRTGRMSSEQDGRAFTFVTPEQGTELTRIEILINTLLHEYRIDGLTVFKEKETQTIDDVPQIETKFSSDSDWDDIMDELS